MTKAKQQLKQKANVSNASPAAKEISSKVFLFDLLQSGDIIEWQIVKESLRILF